MNFPHGRTRRVEGGIRARSTRGAIGESWWSRRFLGVLEGFALGSRLTRGRNYARAGQVLALTVAPGAVTASVQGSRDTPYTVRIELAVFPDPLWTAVSEALSASALYGARLLAGELPPEIEQVFGEAGAPLFPTALRDLTMRCSCPDHAVPCKHLAATFYLLAEEFDADPFQILLWRGRGRDELFAHLGAAAAVEVPSVFAGIPSPPVGQAPERFFSAPVPLPTSRPGVPVHAPDLVLRQLATPAASLGGPRLAALLTGWYRALPADPQ